METFRTALRERIEGGVESRPTRWRIDEMEADVQWRDVGGMRDEKMAFRRMVASLAEEGSYPSRGFVVYGPGGCGKTTLIRAVRTEARKRSVAFHRIGCASLYLDSQPKLRLDFIFQRALVPSLIVMDKVETLAYADGTGTDDSRINENPVFTYMAEKIDALPEGVVIIVETNQPNLLPESLLRSGRLETQVYVEPPDESVRRWMFARLLRNDDLARELALQTKGYTGADIQRIAEEIAAGRLRPSKVLGFKSTLNYAEHANCTLFRRRHSREPVYRTDVTWDDIGGLHSVKREIQFAMDLIYDRPLQTKLGLDAPRGILLQGPPGCGKTMLAKAIANQRHVPLISLKGTDLLAKWLNWSVLKVREVFTEAEEKAPSIIFIDELDSAARRRGVEEGGSDAVVREVVGELLTQMDGIKEKEDIMVIAATNDPWSIDDALLRPGRFDKIIYVPPPDEVGRREIVEKVLGKTRIPHEIDVDRVVKATEGYSGADIENLYQETLTRRYIDRKGRVGRITTADWLNTLTRTPPSVSKHVLKYYENFRAVKRMDKNIPEMYM
ncbi:MAG: ATP-binding protein [Thermoplasmata archaeon]|nr:ATP-binding protein [Thermoplasmata archaeon]